MGGHVDGWVDPAFRAVREVFAASVADGRNAGAAVAAFVDGRAVVDLWGGVADARTGRPWERHTPCVAYSCTKAVTATAALRVVQDAGLTVDAPVAAWWPEYAVAGKESTTLLDLLTHRAGVPAFDRPVTAAEAADPTAMAALLERQRPLWEPGTDHGYHALTFGWLVGEFVRRHTGQTVGDYVRRTFAAGTGDESWPGAPPAAARVAQPRAEVPAVAEAAARVAHPPAEEPAVVEAAVAQPPAEEPAVAEAAARVAHPPAGTADELWLGAPPAVAEAAARIAHPPAEEQAWTADPGPIDAATVARLAQAYRDPSSLLMRATANPLASFNDPQVLAGGWPAAGLVTTARALARFYRDLTDGALLAPALLAEAVRERVRGSDTVLVLESAFGLGYMLPSQNLILPEPARPTAFGHPGGGGALGLGDVANRVAIAFIPNLRRDWLAGDRRAHDLVAAVYAAL